MMRKLDQRGIAAFEFCMVAVAFFTTVFAIFDLARYVITAQSLRTLANVGARTIMIKSCYMDAAINNTAPNCTNSDLPSTTEMQEAAPFLYKGGFSPSLNLTADGLYTITASSNFTMILPIWTLWGTTFNTPSASTKLPFP